MLTSERLAATGKRFYCVCFSVRSGSSLLCEDLAQWGLGEPTECFQFPNPALADVNMNDHLVAMAVAARDECFAFKISWDQAFDLTCRLRADGNKSVSFDLRSVFPNLSYLHVVRQDKIGQAVSAWRAEMSGTWHWPVGSNVTPGYPDYDFESIKLPLQHSLAEDWLWQRHFQRAGIHPLVISYEEYIQDRLSHLQRIIEHLGVPASPAPLEERLQVMRDDWTERVAAAFEGDLYTIPDPLAARTLQVPVPNRASPGMDPAPSALDPVPARTRSKAIRSLASLAAPVAIVIGVAAAAETALPQVALAPLLILAPLVAGLLASPRGIAIVALLAAVVMVPLGALDHVGKGAEIWIVAGIVVAAAAAIWISVRRRGPAMGGTQQAAARSVGTSSGREL